MRDLEPYLDKFSERGRRVLEAALIESRRFGQHFILPEHILCALAKEESDLFDATMESLSISPQDVRLAVEKRLENGQPYAGESFRVAPETTEIFKYSMDRARSEGRRTIDATDICSTLVTSKTSLLEVILQNPEGPIRVFKMSRIGTEDSQGHSFPQTLIKPSKFFAEFALRELVRKNTSPSGLLCAKRSGRGIGGGVSSDRMEQTIHIKHESVACWINDADSDKFDEAEFISSLGEDVKGDIIRNGLKVTRKDRLILSSLHFEYEAAGMKGQIDIAGEMKSGYYELKAMATENCVDKT